MITITTRTRLPKGAIFYYEPSVMQLQGGVIANPVGCRRCITLQRADGTLSIIPKRDIVGMPPALPTPGTASYAMYGSKGDIYTITYDGRFWSCTCRGYEFRKDCRHIRETKNQVENDNGNA
jgi:hypothetical protein